MISKRSVKLFQKAAVDLPAYKSFLQEQGIKARSVKSVDDFISTVPLTNKKQYLHKHPHADLVWKENQKNLLHFSATSGSTGKSYYFPRSERLAVQYSFLIEEYLQRGESKKTHKTLVVIGFGMGVWIGGILTTRAFEIAVNRMKAPVALLPTGYNKVEVFKALRQLAPGYEETIIVGYPPFVKELVDEAPREKIDLKELNVRFLFAAEAFTEKFRDYVCKRAGVKDPLLDTLNIYGTADVGAMAYETPASILIRRLANQDPLLFQDIFGQIEKTPTLAQYDPNFIEFEEIDGEVVLTGDAALPLIRYAVGDNGGVIEFAKLRSVLHKNGYALEKEMQKAGIKDTLKKFPFVYVYERKDLSVTLHGINIYPEFVKEALLTERLSPELTERFTMITKTDRTHNQYLEINLELQKDVAPTMDLEDLAARVIRETLIQKSSEFAEVSKSRNSKKLLKFVFWPNGHSRYFTPDIKQKWVQAE